MGTTTKQTKEKIKEIEGHFPRIDPYCVLILKTLNKENNVSLTKLSNNISERLSNSPLLSNADRINISNTLGNKRGFHLKSKTLEHCGLLSKPIHNEYEITDTGKIFLDFLKHLRKKVADKNFRKKIAIEKGDEYDEKIEGDTK